MTSVLRYIIAGAAVAAAYFSALFGFASHLFHQDTPNSVTAAVHLVPYDAAYLARLAVWQPDRKIALLRRAVRLDPFDARSWIQLGLTTEMQQHDAPTAELDYLSAARVNHMFLPRWTLTNFYFRRQREPEFFHWAKATLEITPYSPDPVFAQMWLMRPNADRIAKAIPESPRILLLYAAFLSNANHATDLPPIVQRLVSAAGSSDPAAHGRDGFIAPIEDRLLSGGYLRPALQIWTSMKNGGWINLAIPTASQPLINGHFAAPFWGHGFDWSIINSPGVSVDQISEEKKLRLTLSGSEPERCSLLQQYVPLQPDRAYHLQWQAEAHGIDPPSGFSWRLSPVPGNSQINLGSGDLLAPSVRAWNFTSPRGTDLFRLTLDYIRPFGKTLATGTVDLRSVSLTPQLRIP